MRLWFQKWVVFVAVAFLWQGAGIIQAQENPTFGPYTPDEHTVLLLHFDGEEITDASPVSHTVNTFGNVSLVESALEGFGDMAWFDNDSRSDSSYVSIPDTGASPLDLQGDWTLEGWVNINSFGETDTEWHWRPALLIKESNYYVEMVGLTGLQYFSGNYWTENYYERTIGESGLVSTNTWYHWTSIRDSANSVLILAIHDEDGNLVDWNVNKYDPLRAPPNETNDPVYISRWGNAGGGFTNGFIDEVRISNTVREFPLPPVIAKGVDDSIVAHVPPNEDIEVKVDIVNYQGNLTSTQVHYSTDGEHFTTLDLSNIGGTTYSATIPGQPAGTEISYYYTAENDLGFSSNTLEPLHPEAASDSVYYGIGVQEEESLVLDLDFEEGPDAGEVLDNSVFDHEILQFGAPTYSEDAADGQYSMYFEGDTSYLEIPQPAANLTGRDMTFDLWFKADSLKGGVAILGKYPNMHYHDWEMGYRFWFRGAPTEFGPEIFQAVDTGADPMWTLLTFGHTMEADTWYRLVVKVSDQENIYAAELYDQDTTLIEEVSMNIDGYIKPRVGQVRIGADYGWANKFQGWIDDLKIYNYVRGLPPAITSVHQADAMHSLPDEDVTVRIDADNVASGSLYYSTGGEFTEVPLIDEGEGTYAADIPGQPAGAVVEYYFMVENSEGRTARSPAGGNNYAVGFWEERTQTLGLTFEEGSGTPADNSTYGHEIVMHGAPTYDSDAIEGDYSLKLEGDSSYLEIQGPAPFLASPQLSVDMWFKADAMPLNGTDIFGIFPAREPVWEFGYRFWFNDDAGHLLPELFLVDPAGPNPAWTPIAQNFQIETDTWYHLIVDVGTDSAFYQLRDTSDEVVLEGGTAIAGHLNTVGGKWTLGHSQFPDLPYFNGKFDDVKFYNYSRSEVVGVEDETDTGLPEDFALDQNYPNPFNPTTDIRYALPEDNRVRLAVYDLLGRKVTTLVNEYKPAGRYTVTWDGTNQYGLQMSTGVYFYRIEAGEYSEVRKMVFLK